MCTVSIMRLPGEMIRVACNRDERLDRPLARPPHMGQLGARSFVMPTDPAGGGTWIAANDAGLVMVLLNLNTADVQKPPAARVSRGRIIPRLIAFRYMEQALAACRTFDAKDQGPFRLVMLDRTMLGEVVSDGTLVRSRQRPLRNRALLFTSSSLGDHLVGPPRKELLDRMLDGRAPSAATQDAFHRHHWPDRPHLSVCMRRRDAQTVSCSVVEIRPDKVLFQYQAGPPDEVGKVYTLTLATQKAARR